MFDLVTRFVMAEEARRHRLDHVPPTPPGVRVWLAAAIAVAVVAAAIAVLYRAMRLVMAVGGSCASGGPYEIATPCPDNVGLLMGLAFPAGMVSAALLALLVDRVARGAASLVVFAWPAVFLSLGWNFLEFGVDPPGGGGLVGGWLVCAVVFVLLATPGLVATPRIVRRIEERRAAVLLLVATAAVAGAVGGWLLAGALTG